MLVGETEEGLLPLPTSSFLIWLSDELVGELEREGQSNPGIIIALLVQRGQWRFERKMTQVDI